MSFLGSVKNFFVSAKAKVSAVFVKIFGADAAQKFGDGALAVLKSALGVIALDAVKAIQASNPYATPADKRQAAYNQIVADSKAQGIQASSSLINLLIELAVSAINGHITQ